jgi:hypothetical protein
LTNISLQIKQSLYHDPSFKAEDTMATATRGPTSTSTPLRAQAVVSSKGQVTLPAIRFELRDQQLVITPELPISAYYGILKGYDLGDIEPEKEPDREFD